MERYKLFRNRYINIVREVQRKYKKHLTQSVIKQPKRLCEYINYKTETRHKIPNLTMEGHASKMIEEDQNKAECIIGYFMTAFSQEPLLDERLDPNTRSSNRPLIRDFGWDD